MFVHLLEEIDAVENSKQGLDSLDRALVSMENLVACVKFIAEYVDKDLSESSISLPACSLMTHGTAVMVSTDADRQSLQRV